MTKPEYRVTFNPIEHTPDFAPAVLKAEDRKELALQIKAVAQQHLSTMRGLAADVRDDMTGGQLRSGSIILGDFTIQRVMTVRVRNRAAESAWGSGPTSPAVATVIISAFCPRCGGQRGEPKNLNQHDDGAYYSVDTWKNPCGHVDMYESVVREGTLIHQRTH